MLEIIIALIALSLLIIFHELGHFLLAKKFNVKVEEFGLGLPPRVFGKKIGETLFSLNAIPFGGFVKMYGEEKDIKDPRSFTGKPIWQRALIVAAGCVAFWVVAVILFSIIFGLGVRLIIPDDKELIASLIVPEVQILTVVSESPAYRAGLIPGDVIKKMKSQVSILEVDNIEQAQEFIKTHQGQEIILTIQRGQEVFEKTLIPRKDPPEGQGRIGVSFIEIFPWWQAPIEGIRITANLTYVIIVIFGQMIGAGITGEPLPPELEGAEVMGPVGIFGFIVERLQMGIIYFLKIIAIIAIHLAIINLLPIPALDGGKLLFLGIEGARGKPIPQKIEQNITGVFFFLLITLIIFITIKDIARLF